jgi:hypothetical protein
MKAKVITERSRTSIPFLGGIKGSDPLTLRPHFTWVFWIAVLLLAVAVISSQLNTAL